MPELPKSYQPENYEDSIYQKWEESGFFNPDRAQLGRLKKPKSFSIVLPPPNVTGQLHLGHASMLSYQDIMIRYHRLKGDKTLWLPGMDHAAIATQNVVEKIIKQAGQTKHDLGREKFLARVCQFAEESKLTIRKQLKKMGSSLDWSREKFTLSKDLSQTVRYVFKKMYDDGLIYRGDRVVNWCPRCQSTLADDEVEYQETPGRLYFIKYGPLTVATTRPETKLGDTGVAVNPQDKRYKDLIGRALAVDLAGHKLKVKVFAAREVEMNFGTGAIGVTPAHSHTDYRWAQENGLEIIKVINEEGRMAAAAGKYQGLTVIDAREKFVGDLRRCGLLEKEEDYLNNLSLCYRCGTPIEPLPSKQWFVDVNKKIPGRGKSLKQLAAAAVKKGDIGIIPDRFNKTYFQWIDNLKDWCISRQIWYGHRIPVWYCAESTEKISRMGFAGDVVPQVFDKKTMTYRLRDHNFKVGDKIAFEDSSANEIFGYGVITKIKKTTVGEIDLNEKKHWKVYKKREELINAFKRHYPEKDIKLNTSVFIYEYKFSPKEKLNEQIIVPKNITELALMRHGLTDWNKAEKIQGTTEVPVDESSLDEIEKIMPQIRREEFDFIITSPLMRARQTAAIISRNLNINILEDELLEERNYGQFEGRKVKEINQQYPDYKKDKVNFDIPGEGEESYQELAARLEKFLKKVAKKYPNKKILVVCHNAVMRTFKMIFEGGRGAELSRYKPSFDQLVKYQILDGCYKLSGFKQDPDTLDTWFSSSLWTFSTLGWPKKTKDLKNFHPTAVLETMYDILFFWVARMIMMSEYLLGEKPFSVVYLHAMVKDKEGRKMSKSLGNGIDPLAMIQKFGADALRLSMIIGSTPGTDLRLYEEKIAGYRNFVNKLWNISRYILSTVKEIKSCSLPDIRSLTLSDKWILAELNEIIEATAKNIEEFKFSQAGEALYEFTWSKLADWYLEIAKLESSFSQKGKKDEILLYILEKLLILWHPFCPFVTEALWEKFGSDRLLMVKAWPKISRFAHHASHLKEFELIKEIVAVIRNARSQHRANPKKVFSCQIITAQAKLIEDNQRVIEGLAKVKITARAGGVKFHLSWADLILDIKENQELKKSKDLEKKNLARYIQIQEAKLNNQDFIKKAPARVIEAEGEKLNQAKEKLAGLG